MESIRTTEYVFPGQTPMKPLSNMALLTLLKRMNSVASEKWVDAADGRPITAHGFRATFRTRARKSLVSRTRYLTLRSSAFERRDGLSRAEFRSLCAAFPSGHLARACRNESNGAAAHLRSRSDR